MGRKRGTSRRKRKRKRKLTLDTVPEDEYELQCIYHMWYAQKYPRSVSCGTPYENMSIHSVRKAKAKGYLTGYPDYVEIDPRIKYTKVGNTVEIEIVPAKFYEFKTPTGRGRVRPEQKVVLKNLKRRGCIVRTYKDLGKSKRKTTKYKREFKPLFKGKILIDLDSGKVTLPKKRALPRLPGREPAPPPKPKPLAGRGRSKPRRRRKATTTTTKRTMKRRSRKK